MINLDPGRAAHKPTLDTTQHKPDSPAEDQVPLGPVQRLLDGRTSFENRDVSLLIALALAEGTRELTKMTRDTSRIIVEARTALLMSLIRAEPRVAAALEDVEFLKTMLVGGVQLGMAAGGAKLKAPKFGTQKLALKAAKAQRQAALTKVYGKNPTKAQAKQFDQAVRLNKSHGDIYYGNLVKRPPMSKAKLIETLEKDRPFGRHGAKTFDNPDGKRLIEAIRNDEIDVAELSHPDETPSYAGTILSFLNQAWDNGHQRLQQDAAEGLHGISDVERELLDAWHARFVQARLELIRVSGQFADVFADIADVTMGVSDD